MVTEALRPESRRISKVARTSASQFGSWGLIGRLLQPPCAPTDSRIRTKSTPLDRRYAQLALSRSGSVLAPHTAQNSEAPRAHHGPASSEKALPARRTIPVLPGLTGKGSPSAARHARRCLRSLASQLLPAQ